MFVKICGTTSEEDALLAVAMGADAVGFIFAPSPRQVTPVAARDIARRLPHGIVSVGVFRNERPEEVVRTVSEAGLHAAQLHGGEPDRDVRWVRERIPFVIRAYAAGDEHLRTAAQSGADVVLLDAAKPGSGTVFDWTLVEGVPARMKVVLAGGLTADNVEEAIRTVRPWGVDVVSGVEASPGRKDATKLRKFVEAARRAEADVAGDDEWPLGDDRPYDWEVDQ
jgi:phosphoribosylanthranilate isomerase